MNKLFTLLGLLTGLTANAQLPNTTNQFIPQENYGINYGFENGKSGHVNSAGTFSITSTAANVARGGFAASMDFSATGQTLTLASRTIPSGLFANNCIAEAMIKGGDANITMQVYDGSNVIASQVLAAYATYTKVSIPFVCPSSGTLAIRFISSADAALFYADDAMWGANYRVGTVAQAKFIGSLKYAGTINCLFSGTSATYANYAADTDCPTATVTGQVTAPGTKIPAATLSSVEPGTYKFTISTTMTAAASECLWRVSDGTNNSDDFSAQYSNGGNFTRGGQVTAFITYGTGQGSTTFNLQHKKVSGTGCDLEVNSTDHDFVMKIEKLPSNSETVYAPNMQPSLGWVDNQSINFSGFTSGSYTVFSDAGFGAARVNNGICQSDTSANEYSCKVAKLSPGKYRVVVEGGSMWSAGSSTGCSFTVTDGVTEIGDSSSYSPSSGGGEPGMTGTNIGGVFNYSSEQINKVFKVMVKRTSGSSDCRFYGKSQLVVYPLEQGIPMPVIVGGTVSTEWADYSLTIGATTTAPTLGTVTVNKASWRRLGDSMEIMYTLKQTSGSSAGSGVYKFPLPSGYIIDTAKMSTLGQLQGLNVVGYGVAGNNNTIDTATAYRMIVMPYDSSNLWMQFHRSADNNLTTFNAAEAGLFSGPAFVSLRATVPISGWKNNQ